MPSSVCHATCTQTSSGPSECLWTQNERSTFYALWRFPEPKFILIAAFHSKILPAVNSQFPKKLAIRPLNHRILNDKNTKHIPIKLVPSNNFFVVATHNIRVKSTIVSDYRQGRGNVRIKKHPSQKSLSAKNAFDHAPKVSAEN